MDLGKVISCNCSMCGEEGHAAHASCRPTHFTLMSGEGDLTSYQFNKNVIDHLFCKTCGVTSFARGKKGDQPMVAINARCLDGVDVEKLDVQHFDGASK